METMRERFTAVTSRLLAEDPRLAVVLADISADAFRPAAARFPDRVINVGIREQLLISVAGGLALTGIRPIAHTFASFLVERPFEQIKLDLTHQAAQAGAVLVSGAASYDYSDNGRTHQSPGDVALLGTLPGWTVHVPGHPDEAERHIRAAARGDGLVYVRLSTEANTVPLDGEPGRLTMLRSGRRGTVLAVGPLADAVVDATLGFDVTVLYASTIRPLDAATLRDSLAGPGCGAGRAVPGRDLGAGGHGRAARSPAPGPRARCRPPRAAPVRHAGRASGRARARRPVAAGRDRLVPAGLRARHPVIQEPSDAQGRARSPAT